MGTFGGGGGVLPVCGEVGGTAGRQRQSVAAGVPQTMFAPRSPCVFVVKYGLLANSVLGRPLFGLTTHWIQSDAFSACAQDPCTYQLAFSPRSRLKRAKTSFESSSERNVPYLM